MRAYIYFTGKILDSVDSKAHKLFCSRRHSQILTFWKLCSSKLYLSIDLFSSFVLWSMSLTASDILSKNARLTDYFS